MQSLVDIFLCPGEVYFAGRDTRLRTILGSCVAMTLWHRERRVGGMCHYMLPGRPNKSTVPNQLLDGRYADEAIELLMQEITAIGAAPSEFEMKLFGGGDMFAAQGIRGGSGEPVGMQNVEAARSLAKLYGFNCVAEHLGGHGHRNVIFEIATGHVWMKHEPRSRQ